VSYLKSIGVTHRYQNSDIFGNLITQIEFAGNGWSHAEEFQVKINNARRQRGRGRLNGVVLDFDLKRATIYQSQIHQNQSRSSDTGAITALH
jgi:hypothetical protein